MEKVLKRRKEYDERRFKEAVGELPSLEGITLADAQKQVNWVTRSLAL